MNHIVTSGPYIIMGVVLSYGFYKNRGRDFEGWVTPFERDWDPDAYWKATPFTTWISFGVLCTLGFWFLGLLFWALSINL